MGLIGDAAMETRCRQRIETLRLPSPLTTDTLIAAVGRQAGCTIDVKPLNPLLGPGVTGLVFLTETGFAIERAISADPRWNLMCLAHELGHILCGHLRHNDAADMEGPAQGRRGSFHVEGATQGLAPKGLLYRCPLNTPIEQEAELTATLLVQRAMAMLTEEMNGTYERPSSDADVMLDRYVTLLNPTRRKRGPRHAG